MTSVYSQPVNTVSYTESEPIHKQTFHPKFIHYLDDDKLNATIDHQPKKLPFNLFLSATEYNKMLITNGKSRKRKTPQIVDGLITSLQFLNDPFFERKISKTSKPKQTQKIQVKPQQKQHIKNCKCSCCHDFYQQCTKHGHKCIKLLNSEVKKGRSIDFETLIPVKNKKYSINYNPSHKKQKFIAQSRRAHSSFDKSRKNNKGSINDESIVNKSQVKKNKDISHLLIKSLIEFTQKKKAEHIHKVSLERTRYAKEQYLKLLNQKIRSYNLQGSRRSGSKSRSKQKSLTKHQISLGYWDQIKDDVLNSLKNDNYSHPLKAQLLNYHINVYDHKQIAPRKTRLTKQQIHYMRQVRGSVAKKTIGRQAKQKKQAQKRIKQNLHSLQKQRKKRISHNPKKPFQPTANLIRSAFQNIVQAPHDIPQAQVRNASSIFTNEGIRKIKTIRKQNIKK